MHDVVATRGIVLSKRTVGEANTLVSMLTEDLGVIRGSARSGRLERSKLRYGLEPLTFGTFSLVRGKYEWKITGTQEITSLFVKPPQDSVPTPLLAGLDSDRTVGTSASARLVVERRKVAGRISRLLLRLIQGEEPIKDLFDVVSRGLTYIAQTSDLEELAPVEWVLVLRILAQLGYVEEGKGFNVFLENDEFSPEIIEQAKNARVALIRAINTSLAETGL